MPSYRYVILGAGRQGTAAAYDLAKFGEAKSLILADADISRAKTSTERLKRLLRRDKSNLIQIKPVRLDVMQGNALGSLLRGNGVVLSALPYRLNPIVATAAVQAKVHYGDLGGHLETTREILRLDSKARKAQITMIPDLGLAPGLSTILAVSGIEKLDISRSVRIFCGGLPQNPRPPLDYKIVYNLEGLLAVYFGEAYVLRRGKIAKAPALSEQEDVEFEPPLGNLEAAITGGGTSTCPWTFQNQVQTFEYKTLRYRGHFEKIRLLAQIGLMEEKPVKVNGFSVIPRQFFKEIMARHLDFPEDKDLVALRVQVRGIRKGAPAEICYDLLDFQDAQTGFSAMERTTGFSAGIVLAMLAKGQIRKRGALPVEKAVPAQAFMDELRKRGFRIKETQRRLESMSEKSGLAPAK